MNTITYHIEYHTVNMYRISLYDMATFTIHFKHGDEQPKSAKRKWLKNEVAAKLFDLHLFINISNYRVNNNNMLRKTSFTFA